MSSLIKVCNFVKVQSYLDLHKLQLMFHVQNILHYYIPKKDSHSLCSGVTVQYFSHIARSQVHIAWS